MLNTTNQTNEICEFFIIDHQPYTTLILEFSVDILIFTSILHKITNVPRRLVGYRREIYHGMLNKSSTVGKLIYWGEGPLLGVRTNF